MIKKIFQITGLLVLTCISFIYTEKAMLVVREKDPLMIEISEKQENYYQKAQNAKIEDKTIIPGIEGMEVDIKASYENMKKYGLYNENMLKFKTIKPDISINKTYDKYIISGNKTKKMVTLIFEIEKEDNIDNITKILDKTNIKATFFFDIENNIEQINKLISAGHEVGHMNYKTEQEILSNNRKIKTTQKYCYTKDYDDNILKNCSSLQMHTVKPITINSTITLKKVLQSGSLISLKPTKTLEEELEHMINYIKQKGFNITTLTDHLNEKILEN